MKEYRFVAFVLFIILFIMFCVLEGNAQDFYIPSFTNYSFSAGNFSQWEVVGFGKQTVTNDLNAEDGKSAWVKEQQFGVLLKTPKFLVANGVYAEARFYNPLGIDSCAFTVFYTNGARTNVMFVFNRTYESYTFDLTPWQGQTIQVGFAGGQIQMDYLKLLVPDRRISVHPAIELIYETVPGKSYQLQGAETLNLSITWTNLGSVVLATNGTTRWIQSTLYQSPHHYYRIKEL